MAHQQHLEEKKKKHLQVARTTKGTGDSRHRKVMHTAVIATVGDSLLKFGWDIKRVGVDSGLQPQ